MKKASISELKNQLSAFIDGVQRGRPLLIVDRGRPVARLEPIAGTGAGPQTDARLARLEREGVLRHGRTPFPSELLDAALPCPSADGSAVAALLDEREDGR